MYRKSMEQEKAPVEGGGSEFIARLSQLPASQVAVEQISIVYRLAMEQRLLAMGLKAGEGTLNLAVKMATPIVNIFPVSSIDSMACRQLQKLEEAVPGLTKMPPRMVTHPGEVMNTALAPAVSAVKQIGHSTVSEVKNFASETSAPTVERVAKATTYGKQTFDSAYVGAKETVIKLCTRDGVQSAVNSSYATVRSLTYDDVMSGVEARRNGLVSGVRAGVEGVRLEVGAYALDTLRPTVTRVTAVKQYTVEKVSDTYTGVKGMGNRAVDSVYNNRLVTGVHGVFNGVLDFAEHALDTYLPPDADAEQTTDEDQTSVMEIHPASPQAGSWTRSMVLFTNFRQRLNAAGTRNYKYYSTEASDWTDYATKRYTMALDTVHSTYDHSYNYVAGSYATTKTRLENSRQRVIIFYSTAKTRFTTTQEYTSDALRRSYAYLTSGYSTARKRVAGTTDYAVELYHSADKGRRLSVEYVLSGYNRARQMGGDVRVAVVDTLSVGLGRAAGMYDYVTELTLYTIDEARTTWIYKQVFVSSSKQPIEELPMQPLTTPSKPLPPPKQPDILPLAESSPKIDTESLTSEAKIDLKMGTPTTNGTSSPVRVRSSAKKSATKSKLSFTEPDVEITQNGHI